MSESVTKTFKKPSKTVRKRFLKLDSWNMKWKFFKKNMQKTLKRSFYYSKSSKRRNFIKKPLKNKKKSSKNSKNLLNKPSKIPKKPGKSKLKWSSSAVKTFSLKCKPNLTKEK
jgi:hypothetical protein